MLCWQGLLQLTCSVSLGTYSHQLEPIDGMHRMAGKDDLVML